jgi:hypothetical protein
MLGAEHPDTLRIMNNLASTLWAQGDYASAQSLQEEVLAVSRRVLGSEHPDTLRIINNLAVTLFQLVEVTKARELVAEALSIAIEKYGPAPTFSQALINTAVDLGMPLPPDALLHESR